MGISGAQADLDPSRLGRSGFMPRRPHRDPVSQTVQLCSENPVDRKGQYVVGNRKTSKTSATGDTLEIDFDASQPNLATSLISSCSLATRIH